MIPRPMPDPCADCSKKLLCLSADTYKCPAFCETFIRSWDETVAFLKAQLLLPHQEG